MLAGHVDITAEVLVEEAKTFVLDCNGLEIHSVGLAKTGEVLQVGIMSLSLCLISVLV